MIARFQNQFYLIILFISFFTIISALYIEHVLSIPACKLCLYQRIPYVISIVICFFGYFFSKNKIWCHLLITTFLGSIIISGYHLGIENNFYWQDIFLPCIDDNDLLHLENQSKKVIRVLFTEELCSSIGKYSSTWGALKGHLKKRN